VPCGYTVLGDTPTRVYVSKTIAWQEAHEKGRGVLHGFFKEKREAIIGRALLNLKRWRFIDLG